MQRGIAPRRGQTERLDDQLGSPTGRGVVYSGNRLRVRFVQDDYKIILEPWRCRKRMVAPAAADMMDRDLGHRSRASRIGGRSGASLRRLKARRSSIITTQRKQSLRSARKIQPVEHAGKMPVATK